METETDLAFDVAKAMIWGVAVRNPCDCLKIEDCGER